MDEALRLLNLIKQVMSGRPIPPILLGPFPSNNSLIAIKSPPTKRLGRFRPKGVLAFEKDIRTLTFKISPFGETRSALTEEVPISRPIVFMKYSYGCIAMFGNANDY